VVPQIKVSTEFIISKLSSKEMSGDSLRVCQCFTQYILSTCTWNPFKIADWLGKNPTCNCFPCIKPLCLLKSISSKFYLKLILKKQVLQISSGLCKSTTYKIQKMYNTFNTAMHNTQEIIYGNIKT
jgi:hypothetical protein